MAIMALYHMNNFPKIIKVLPKKPQASTAVRDITPIYATASISLKNKFYPGLTNQTELLLSDLLQVRGPWIPD